MKISVETIVKADMVTVWSAWITPQDINQWNAASEDWHNPKSENDFRIGGRFSYRMEEKTGAMGFDFEGVYIKIIEYELIEYQMEDGRSVQITFAPVDGGVRIIETFDAEDEFSGEQQRQGWQSILNNFTRHVESKD
ncbi:MAG: hypothetical protein DHS20C05_14380 [Hyphococcus sp.]|nr:MAG: hypothetical protein DHS20C05_14380 [Marinicaulis sp.]